jgi:hypothetical protein
MLLDADSPNNINRELIFSMVMKKKTTEYTECTRKGEATPRARRSVVVASRHRQADGRHRSGKNLFPLGGEGREGYKHTISDDCGGVDYVAAIRFLRIIAI